MDNQHINQNSERKTISDWVKWVGGDEKNYESIYQNEEDARWFFESFNNGFFLDYLASIEFKNTSITLNLDEFKSFLGLTIWMYGINNNKEDIKKIQEVDLNYISPEPKTISDWAGWASSTEKNYNFICEGDNQNIEFSGLIWYKGAFQDQYFINDLQLYIKDNESLRLYIKDPYIDNKEFTINEFLIIIKKFFINYKGEKKKTHEDALQNLSAIRSFLIAYNEKEKKIDEEEKKKLSNVSTNTKIIITLTTLVILAGLSYMVYIFKTEPAIKRKTIKTQFDIKSKRITEAKRRELI